MSEKNKNIEYIKGLLEIIDKGIEKIRKHKHATIPFEEFFGIVNDIYALLLSDEKLHDDNFKIRGEICKTQFIRVLNFLIKVDSDKERAVKYYEILKYAYKIAARVSLEHYFIYREWDDKVKYFMPRYNILQGYVHYLEEIDLNPNFELLIANFPSGYGKLLANDTPILTRKGWKKHGDLVVGDEVISPSGEFIKVTYVHPKRLANVKVTFEDGEEILCHNQHEWQVYDKVANKEKHVETNYMLDKFKYEENGVLRNRFYIPLREMVKGEEKDLPVDPYTYGTILKKEKYINDMYLTASIEQRLELLAGIIDTDGHLDQDKQRYIITTANERLKEDIKSLIYTFNWRVSVTKTEPTTSSSGIVGKNPIYYISFSPTIKIPCKLKRKQLTRVHKQRRIGISNIEFIRPKQGNCITVEGGLYLAGRTLKMTHNTYTEKISEAWSYGVDNTGAILSLCSNETVVNAGSRVVMNEIKEPHFGEVFPNMKYDKEDKSFFLKETESDWKLRDCTLGSSYNAATVRTNVVGQRASKRIHIDDLYANHKEAESRTLNNQYDQDYHSVWKKRFIQEAPTHKVVITGTLWSSDDLIARLISYYTKQKKFVKSKKYPYTFVSEDGTMAIIRVPALDYITGESTCPNIRSTEKVLEDKNAVEDYLFQTNWQQIPTDPEALFFSYTKLQTYTTLPKECSKESYAVIDATRKSGKDYFAMPIFSKLSQNNDLDKYYLKDCIFTREATNQMYNKIVDKIIQNEIRHLVIESNVTSELSEAINKLLRQNNIGWCEIEEKYNTIPKSTRIEVEKGTIKKQLVFPEKGMYGIKTEMGLYMDNLVSYNNEGSNPNDDAPDSSAMFCSEIINKKEEEEDELEVIDWIRELI